jgi:tetratricopeptide (TPR) repeat protein
MLRLLPAAILFALLAMGQSANDANALFQKQDWAGAAPLYETAVKANPADGPSWFRLGTCLHRLNHNQESRAAFQRSLDLGFQPLQAMVVIARSYYKEDDKAEGYKWLRKAADAGFANPALLDADPDFLRVKNDPDFAKARVLVVANAHPCMNQPEYRQFDFWIGDWDVMSPGAAGPVPSRIERILDGCIIQENWMPPGQVGGKSWNFYNAATKEWEQLWIAPTGVIKMRGEWRDGAMRFESRTPVPGQPDQLAKLTFTPMEGGRVHQFWVRSTDGGKTWTTMFDGIYSPRKTQ